MGVDVGFGLLWYAMLILLWCGVERGRGCWFVMVAVSWCDLTMLCRCGVGVGHVERGFPVSEKGTLVK